MALGRPFTFWQKTKIAFGIIFHRQTPLSAKALLFVGLLYGLLPLDVIPDFLPVLGQIDDAVIILAVILYFLRITKTLRAEAERNSTIIDI